MPGEQTDLCKVSTSGAASPGSRSGNPAASGRVLIMMQLPALLVATCLPAQHKIRALTQHAPRGSRLKVFARSGRKRHAQNRRNAIAIRCNRRELWQFGADSDSQVGRQHINRIKTSANGPEDVSGHACNIRALFAAVVAVAPPYN